MKFASHIIDFHGKQVQVTLERNYDDSLCTHISVLALDEFAHGFVEIPWWEFMEEHEAELIFMCEALDWDWDGRHDLPIEKVLGALSKAVYIHLFGEVVCH
jgi:hypothetical protein